ncbi:O-fucosyltransferase family protein [Spirosoma rigui]|uniref:hypothetical protein n=1 Tax=Spirosoma rigui TaxID=564064 RepID=UPI0009B1A283|nr:hypothetical protein [Spirosoma rigui]
MVIAQKNDGQFGNKLLISAHIIAYCLSRQEPLVSFTLGSYAHYFRADRFRENRIYLMPLSWQQRFLSAIVGISQRVAQTLFKYRVLERHRVGWVHTELRDITSRKAPLLQLEGEGFRSTTDLLVNATRIRQLFTPKRVYSETVKRIVEPLKRDYDVLIGVHLRRADYRQWQGGKYYFDDNIYRNVIVQMRGLLTQKKPVFILCSDEPLDAAYFSEQDLYLSKNEMIIDLYLLASCDYLIGPPSTFSGWSSFYGNVPLWTIENQATKISLADFKSCTL